MAYILSGIFKTVFKIFLLQILKKLQIHNTKTAKTAEAYKNGKNRSKFRDRTSTFGLGFPKLSLKFFYLKYLGSYRFTITKTARTAEADKTATIVQNSQTERLRLVCCLLYTSPSPRDGLLSRMPSSA